MSSCQHVGREKVKCLRLQEKYGKSILSKLRQNGILSIKRINGTARTALEDGYWSQDLRAQVGGVLLRELMEVAVAGEEKRKVFVHEKQVRILLAMTNGC